MSQVVNFSWVSKTYAYEKLKETLVVKESTRRSMQGNRGSETKPELMLRKAIWAAGLRGYRKNVKTLPGRPDIVFPTKKLAVFIHGCYWHRCPRCTRNIRPKTNARYWNAKFEANVERDARNLAALRELGYRVEVVWECELKENLIQVVERLKLAHAG